MSDILATRIADAIVFEAKTQPARIWMGTLYASTVMQFDLVQQQAQAKNFLSAAAAVRLAVSEAPIEDAVPAWD